MATKVSINPFFRYIKTFGGISEYKLKSNGLQVLLLNDPYAPIIGTMMTYLVGSRNEAVGYTGAAHLLEHLLFKGSKKFPKGVSGEDTDFFEASGTMMNATTWLDRTNYYMILQNKYVDKALSYAADHMRNAYITEEDRSKEMPVVRGEFEFRENRTYDILEKHVWATAYQAHPYHHPTMGWYSDIENMSIEKLKEFYNLFYWPTNATLSIVGNLDQQLMLSTVHKYFGGIPSNSHDIPNVYTKESKQEGARMFTVQVKAQSNAVFTAYKTPPGAHKDTHTLHMLASILGFGKSSRLYKKLVDAGVATEILVESPAYRDNGLFQIFVLLTSQSSHENVLGIITKEIDDIQKNGVTERELSIALTKVEAGEAYSRDGVYSILDVLNEAIAMGDWTFYIQFVKKIKKVTTKDIQNSAIRYLTKDQSTTGLFIGTT